MYVKAINDVVDTFPYYVNDLKADNPNTSLPDSMTDETLESWDVYPVVVEDQPAHTDNQTVSLNDTPVLSEGVWSVGWTIRSWSQEELDETAENIRERRDELLSSCDWTQIPDSPLSDEDKTVWQTYRQELRDITGQAGFPTDVTWPTEP